LNETLRIKYELLKSNEESTRVAQRSLVKADRNISECQGVIASAKHTEKMLTLQMATQRLGVTKASEAVQELRYKRKEMDKEQAKLSEYTYKIVAEVEALRSRHALVLVGSFSAEENLKSMYSMIEAAEMHDADVRNKLETTRRFYMDKIHATQLLKAQIKDTDREINVGHKWAKSLRKEMADIEFQVG
jgi:hypothetical protein